jgi:hypothetical protein
MPLNSSGPISLAGTTTGQSIALELGLSGTAQISLNNTNVRTLAGVPTGAIVMPTNFWGKANTINGYLITTNVRSNSGVPLFSVVQSDTSGMISYYEKRVGVFFNPSTGVISSSTARFSSTAAGNSGYAAGFYSSAFNRWVAFSQGTNVSGFSQFNSDCSTQAYYGYISNGFSDASFNDLFITAGGRAYVTTTRSTSTWSYSEYVPSNSTSQGPEPAGIYSSGVETRCGGFVVTPDRTKMFVVFVTSTTTALCSINLSTGVMTSLKSLFDGSFGYTGRGVYSGIAANNNFLYVTNGSTAVYCFTANLTTPALQWSTSYTLPAGISIIRQGANLDISQGTFLVESANSILLVQAVNNGNNFDARIAVVGFNKATGAIRFSYILTTPNTSNSLVYFSVDRSPTFITPPSATSTLALLHLSIASSSFGAAGSLLAVPFDNALANGTYETSGGGYGSSAEITVTNYTATAGTPTAPASPILTAMTRTGTSYSMSSSTVGATSSTALANISSANINGA